MLSRVADSLYWMSRYLERAEHTARLLDTSMNLMMDESTVAVSGRWEYLLEALKLPHMAVDSAGALGIIRTLTFDAVNHSSVRHSIAAARENLRHVREQISSDMWEQLNRLYLEVTSESTKAMWQSQPHDFFRLVIEGAHLFQGVTDSTMTHGEGWHFIQVGRFIERAGELAALVDVHFRRFPGAPDVASDYLEWVGLLKSCTAFEPYCKAYTAQLSPRRIAEFLVLNPEFPHSVRFSVERVREAMGTIGEITATAKAASLARLSGRLLAKLRYSQLDEILAEGLHGFLEEIQQQCLQIHSTLNQIYVNYPIESVV